jgi:23S rRNA pseudouridine1911/1915/1917 synthase
MTPREEPNLRLFVTTPAESGQTLATALRTWLTGESWSQIKHRIAARRVRVHGSLCMDHARVLAVGEEVEVLAESLPLPPGKLQVVLRYVDADLVVVEKQAGMTTLRHTGEKAWPLRRKQQQPSLDEAVAELLAEKEGLSQPEPLRSVHRIDKETSGLLVFARTPVAEQQLIAQFSAHSVKRRYLAVVLGTPPVGTIRSHFVRDRGDGLRGSTQKPEIGQEAITHVNIAERLGDYSLIECRLETGRTHQIRIHLTEAGHPLCGDRVYRAPFGQSSQPDESRAARMALHAAELGFVHPRTRGELRYESPLPVDMQKLVERLRRV